MKTTVCKNDFIRAFQDVRPGQFSHAGLSALYDFLKIVDKKLNWT
jgi:hypothetical protein